MICHSFCNKTFNICLYSTFNARFFELETKIGVQCFKTLITLKNNIIAPSKYLLQLIKVSDVPNVRQNLL